VHHHVGPGIRYVLSGEVAFTDGVVHRLGTLGLGRAERWHVGRWAFP
jgi:hypothetical protein